LDDVLPKADCAVHGEVREGFTMQSKWREVARQTILKVVRDNRGKTEKEMRKLLAAAYPFGFRELHPYKIWLSELRKHGYGRKKQAAPLFD
jgi:hypothetical protein